MNVSQILLNSSVSASREHQAVFTALIFALSSPLAIAHGNKLNVPDTGGMLLELEIKQHLIDGVPDRQYHILTPTLEQAEAIENGFNTPEVTFAVTTELSRNWLAHGAISNHSHDGESELDIDQAFIQGEVTVPGTEQSVTLRIGRFYSAAGYYNEQGHGQALTPVTPLAYQAFMGGELQDDGLSSRLNLSGYELGLELFSGNNHLSGNQTGNNFSNVQVIYLDKGLDIGSDSHLDFRISFLNADQHFSSGDGHSHSASDINYQLTGDLQQLMLSSAWQYQQWTLSTELFKRKQDARITTSDQLINLDDQSHGGYIMTHYDLNEDWSAAMRYGWITSDLKTAGHQSLVSSLNIPVEKSPQNLNLSVHWQPARNQIWALNLGQQTEQWQGKKDSLYGGLSYRLMFDTETL